MLASMDSDRLRTGDIAGRFGDAQMLGLHRLFASLDQFFFNMAMNSLPLGERITECFCETVIADGTLRYLPDNERERIDQLMNYHLGFGIEEFDEDEMQKLFSTREYFVLNDFVGDIFRLKQRIQELVPGEKLELN